MADNQETPDVSARDIAELLHRFDVTIAAHGQELETLSDWAQGHRNALKNIEEQVRSNGEQISKTQAQLSIGIESLESAVIPPSDSPPVPGTVWAMLADIHKTVREAAPLLQSRAAKALRAGGSVIDYLKAGRSGG